MDIGELLTDSIKYPISDWTKILILGIIFVIGSIASIVGVFNHNGGLLSFLGIIGFLVGLLAYGYIFRIIKSSLAGSSELPDFDSWLDMFIDGIKVFIVGIIYALPAIIIILLFSAATILSIFANPSSSSAIAVAALAAGIGVLIAFLYLLIIIPIIAIALTNMAFYNSEFGAAFRFSEIFDKIARLGWGNLIVWYIVVGIIFIILAIIGGIITGFFSLISPALTTILMALIVTPFLWMYLGRAVALLYMSE